jgi:hypothetical protein
LLILNKNTYHIENALSSAVFIITTPPFSFAGLSLAGIGDLNNDGFADIAIGSIPYQGGYSTQRTFIIYGRSSATGRGNTLDINEMIVGKDGFAVIGGGFLVAGIGDVNQDGIADCVISRYYNWQSKGNAYLMNYPRNMTSSPTYLPSSLPSSYPSTSPSSVPSEAATTYTPSNHPSVITSPPVKSLQANESSFPSYASTVKPTKATNSPTVKKTSIPSVNPTSFTPSLTPTVIPSLKPTGRPIADTVRPSRKPTILPKTKKPSFVPTVEPTSNQTFSIDGTSFDVITFDKPGDYIGASNTNQVFVLSASGVYRIQTRPPGDDQSNNGVKDVKLFSLVPVYNQIIVDGFDSVADVIDLRKYPTIRSFEDLSYSTNPLIIKLPASSQPLFLLSPSSSDTEVTSEDKVSSSSESSSSSSSSTSNEIQDQTLTLISFKSLTSLSENNFKFVPRLAPNPVNSVDSSGRSFQLLFAFGFVITVVSIVFFFKCVQEDINSEEKEELKENEYELRFTQIEIDNENQLDVIIVQNTTSADLEDLSPVRVLSISRVTEEDGEEQEEEPKESVFPAKKQSQSKSSESLRSFSDEKSSSTSENENESQRTLESWEVSNSEEDEAAVEEERSDENESLQSWELSDDGELEQTPMKYDNTIEFPVENNSAVILPVISSPPSPELDLPAMVMVPGQPSQEELGKQISVMGSNHDSSSDRTSRHQINLLTTKNSSSLLPAVDSNYKIAQLDKDSQSSVSDFAFSVDENDP